MDKNADVSTGGREARIADGLKDFQEFGRLLPASVCQEQLGRCQARVHIWGKTNRVSFSARAH